MTTKHSIFSPSAAARWLKCPASVPFTKDMPDEKSEYALEGTFAHELAAQILEKKDISKTLERAAAAGFDVKEMQKHVKYYTDFVESIGGGVRYIEKALDLTPLLPVNGERGTADCIIIKDNNLYIIDLKYGMNRVNAPNNPQLVIYAAAVFCSTEYDLAPITNVSLIIVQPRIDNISQWDLTPYSLCTEGAFIARAAQSIRYSMECPSRYWHFCPSEEACKYCKGRGVCRAYANAALSAAGESTFDNPDKPELDNDEIAKAYKAVGIVEKWVDTIKAKAYSILAAGETLEGFKLVAGREGARKWADEKEAERLLKSMRIRSKDMYEKKLLSPPKVEKVLKGENLSERQWAKLQNLITRGQNKPVIAPEGDKRPAISLAPRDYPDESK